MCSDANSGTVFEVMGPFNQINMPEKNDWVRYIEVNTYDEVNDPRVMILGGISFNIDSSALLPAGWYLASDMKNRFFVDVHNGYTSPSGIVVPDKMTAILYTGDNFEGTQTVIAGPAKVNFHNSQTHGHLMDRVRSVVVTRVTNQNVALQGRWTRVASYNGPLSYEIERGYSITDGKMTEEDLST